MNLRVARIAFALAAALTAFASPALAGAQATMALPSDPMFLNRGSWGQAYFDQWALHRIGFDGSPNSAFRVVRQNAQPVVVAIIDTGLDWNHAELDQTKIWRNPRETPDNRVDDDRNGYVDDIIGWDFFDRDNQPFDYDGHGTFVAGVIAARWNNAGIAGVNPFARIMVVKAINNFGHTRASYIAEAIAYAVDNGARVINLSVGGKEVTRVEQAAIDYAYARGAVMVVAAGNEGADIGTYGIAGSPKVLTVAATGLNDERMVFSNWGGVAVAAPGLDVLSLRGRRTDTMLGIPGVNYNAGAAFVGADSRYYRASGTSFSAPLVAGVASLLLSHDPTLTNVQVANILKSTARDVGTPGVDQYTGYGIVDARAALLAQRDYVLAAAITRVEVVQEGGMQLVRVRGTADANGFRAARIEIGAGEAPSAWTLAAPVPRVPDADAPLASIPAASFRGAAVWQIRLTVQHQNGSVREARFRLAVG
jgi:hypothetical protein